MKPTKISLCNKTARHLHIPSNKPTLVFIPGNLQEIETITAFNEGFSKCFDYHVIELPGTGLTSPLHPSYNVNFLSKCLEEFVESHFTSPIHLVTCSYATAIGIEFAKHNEQKLSKLVLAGSMEEIPEAEWPTVLGLMADCLRDPKRFASDFLDLLTSDNPNIPKLNLIRKATERKASRYTEQQFWCFIYNSIRLMSYRATNLNKIRCETLCFTGEYDPYVTADRCKQLSQKVPFSTFTTISDADHLFHIEKPEETIRLICNYLENKLTVAA